MIFNIRSLSVFSAIFIVSFIFLGASKYANYNPIVYKHNFYINNASNVGFHKSKYDCVINWNESRKLTWADFKANKKKSNGSAVATTSTAFGYSITDSAGIISGSIYVHFFCNDSWWDHKLIQKNNLSYVLSHEQLHFDICELFGRKLYKAILKLRDSGRLNSNSIKRLQTKLEKQYSSFQDRYDKETNHSINRTEQHYWSKIVKKELDTLSEYSEYDSF